MNDVTMLVPPSYSAGTLGDPLSNIDVLWNPKLIEIPSEAAAFVDECWAYYEATARTKNKTLFNGAITQLLDARRLPNGRVQLTLGPSDYKTFLVSCVFHRSWFEMRFPHIISRALGNSALLTHKDEVLLAIRSAKVSVYAGRAHLIGGVLELLNTEKFPATPNGMLAHLQMELAEEAHITSADLEGEPRLLFVGQDNIIGQPEAVWHCPAITPLDQLAARLDPLEHINHLKLQRRVLQYPWLPDSITPEALEAWSIWSG